MNIEKIKKNQNAKEYIQWKNKNFENKQGFFPVFLSFKSILNKISPGAVSLYLYFGLNSNKEGFSFHKIETIANYFNRSPRTISNWINELVDIGLIERKQYDLNSVSITYLKPYEFDNDL